MAVNQTNTSNLQITHLLPRLHLPLSSLLIFLIDEFLLKSCSVHCQSLQVLLLSLDDPLLLLDF